MAGQDLGGIPEYFPGNGAGQAEPAPISRCWLGVNLQLDALAQVKSPPASLVR